MKNQSPTNTSSMSGGNQSASIVGYHNGHLIMKTTQQVGKSTTLAPGFTEEDWEVYRLHEIKEPIIHRTNK